MTSVKIKFRSSIVDDREGTLYYQVIQKRVVRQIHSGYKIFASEWNGHLSEVVLPFFDESRSGYLLTLQRQIVEDIALLKGIVRNFEQAGKDYTSDEVVECYLSVVNTRNMVAFTRQLLGQLRQIGRDRTAETYATALNSFIRFREKSGEGDIPLAKVDSRLMMAYEIYLKSQGVCPNSSSFYMRNLRAIYNRAVEQGMTVQRSPFKYVYTGIDKTVKRAVSIKVIRQIRDLDLTHSCAMEYARDMFLFSFYTRGMSFVDMAFLKKKDLQNGVLVYRRRKTGQQLFVRWEKPMQEIVERYLVSDSPFLLPIIRNIGVEERRQYRNSAHLINARLKWIGKVLHTPVPLTMYVARHAWASIAKSKNIPLSVISEGMGHDSENTTRIYLASLDTSVVDKANRCILRSL
ncbi:MAG: site-specific integrase [Odoribacter sp.]|nr:site-specific integrase [Odoribacter sp.]